jgi:ABC-type polar amino acid transport system ATPase subunit
MLSVKNICKSVNGKILLNSISFDVPRGTIAAFLGGSGAGKTTLLRALNNLETIDSGSVLLDDVPLDLSTVSKNHTVGMVFQHFNLFEHLSVEENITLPLTQQGSSYEQAQAIASALLEKYGLLDKAKNSVAKLSGGQKQRLAIARSQALNPQIICLDEPTSALDPILTSQVATYVQDLANENRIVLLTTHDMALIQRLDCHLFFMNQGAIVEHTTTQDYLTEPSRFPHFLSYFT